MATTLHQLKCFQVAMETRSFTKAAELMGVSQPALSDQIKLLENSVRAPLFVRLGRGVRPTEAGAAFLPHALAALSSVDSGQRAVGAVSRMETGTVRFGLFGAAHLYIAADLITTVAQQHPGLDVVLIGQNSADVIADIRGGRLEAGLVALPVANDEQLTIRPVATDEVVFVSAHRKHTRIPLTPEQLAAMPLVLSEATWGDRDYTRSQLSRAVQSAGLTLQARFEVENVETALQIAARGHADTIAARGVLRTASPSLTDRLHYTALEPAVYDEFAIVYRRDVPTSRPVQAVMTYARELMVQATTSGT